MPMSTYVYEYVLMSMSIQISMSLLYTNQLKVITHITVVGPEDVRRRLRRVPDDAGKVQRAARVDVKVRAAHYQRDGLWKAKRQIIIRLGYFRFIHFWNSL